VFVQPNQSSRAQRRREPLRVLQLQRLRRLFFQPRTATESIRIRGALTLRRHADDFLRGGVRRQHSLLTEMPLAFDLTVSQNG